jgi:hypothetical protein
MAEKTKGRGMILFVGMVLIVSGFALVYDYFDEKKQVSIVCGTDSVGKMIKALKEELSLKISTETDRVNSRLDFIAGWREPRGR